jgi:hypothetical protein
MEAGWFLGSPRGAVLSGFAGVVCLAALASGCGSSKPKHIAVADVRTCMTSHGYTFKNWSEDTLGFFKEDRAPTNGAYEAKSADGSVSVEYAFGEDATEAKDNAQQVDQLNDLAQQNKNLAQLLSDKFPAAKSDTQIQSNVAYWWSADWGGDKDTVKSCLSRAETTTVVLPKIGLCKKPGIHYKGTTAEGVKVCFTLSPDGRDLIQNAWIFARNSGSGCTGIPRGHLDTATLDNHRTGASGQHFDAGELTGTIRDAEGSLLSTATGELSDEYDCPGKTFKWTAYRTPSRVARPSKEGRALLPKMVIPDASLARLADGARKRFAFYTNANDAAASTFDPNDTGADLRRMGRIAGYIRGRNVARAFVKRAPKGLLATSTSVILWKDGRSAAASIERDLASGKRFSGKRLQGGLLVSYAARKVPLLGAEEVLEHVRTPPTGGTDRFATGVLFHVGSLRANATVARGDRFADRAALQVAKQLKLRVVAVLRSSH